VKYDLKYLCFLAVSATALMVSPARAQQAPTDPGQMPQNQTGSASPAPASSIQQSEADEQQREEQQQENQSPGH
jgi:hypothetical protein